MVEIKNLNLREEAINLRYEPAVDLGDVVKGSAPFFMQNFVEFFERTHLTESMKTLIIKTLMNLIGLREVTIGGSKKIKVSSNLILLPSDLGGGKTHSLILLYHVVKLIATATNRDEAVSKLKMLDKDIAEFVASNWESLRSKQLKVVIVDCKYSDLAPSPALPIKIAGREIKTLWGYLGYELGKYELVSSSDEKEVAPYADVIFNVFNESKALVLIDEIGRYYDQSGLAPSVISTFLMNLAEAMSKYTIREVAVVVTLPYEIRESEIESRESMKYVHAPELVEAINKILNRPNVEIVKPVEKGDLVEILRKRIFAHKGEFEKFAEEYVADKVSKEYPVQVREALDNRGFWRTVKKTYPFHPQYLDLLEKLVYKLPYLQKTRDAIKITVQTVLAIREGFFSFIEDKVDLISPYHVPVFISEVLDETVLRNAPSEYKVFQLILSSNMFELQNYEKLKSFKPDDFLEKVIARSLREAKLKKEDLKLGTKLVTVIWLHSLIGLGLPANMGDYPTTTDLIYSVSPIEYDVKGLLSLLRSILPQLIVHGDPASENAKWFFTNIPSLEELVEILKKNVTDVMAKEKLAEFIENGLKGKKAKGRPLKDYKTESIFENTATVRRVSEVPEEILSSKDPAIIAFADVVDKKELENLLEAKNHIVALAPYVERYDELKKISPEDAKGIKELARLKDATVWDGLLDLLRYYVAVESISDKHISAFISGNLGKGHDEAFLEDILKLMNEKVEGLKDYYYKNVWNMINKCYTKVYYYRQGNLLSEEGLNIESDKPLAPIVESFLRNKGLVPAEFNGKYIITIFEDYMDKNSEEDEININTLWSFIRTTTKAKVPIISWKMFLDAIKDLIRTLDYAVIIGKTIIWKPIFSNSGEAEMKDESEELLELLNEEMKKQQLGWDNIKLVYWRKVFDDWLNFVLEKTPRNKVLKIKDRSGNIYNVSDVKIERETTVKNGKLFYEEKKYLVEVEAKFPEEIWEKKDYEAEVDVKVGNFDGEIEVKLTPSKGLVVETVEPKEPKGKSPLHIRFKFRAENAGRYTLKFEVFSNLSLLDSKVETIDVKGEWIEEEITIKEKGEPIPGEAKVIEIIVLSAERIRDVLTLAKSYEGMLYGNVVIASSEEEVRLEIKAKKARVLELLWSSINNLVRTAGGNTEIEITHKPTGEPSLREVIDKIIDTRGIKFKIRRKLQS